MSLLKNFKSLFIIEEEPAAPTAEPPTASTAKASTSKPSDSVESAAEHLENEPFTGRGKVKEKFVNILLGVLEENNLEGVDYFEYRQSLQSLKKMAMDEATRYQSAFAMAQTMGADPKRLMDSGAFYLDLLKKEEIKFEQALVKQQNKQIDTRKNEKIQLQREIEAKQKQIAELQQQIAKHQDRLTQIDSELGLAKQKIDQTRLNFVASYQFLKDAIGTDLERMSRYLK